VYSEDITSFITHVSPTRRALEQDCVLLRDQKIVTDEEVTDISSYAKAIMGGGLRINSHSGFVAPRNLNFTVYTVANEFGFRLEHFLNLNQATLPRRF
jgi:hypothetical protein